MKSKQSSVEEKVRFIIANTLNVDSSRILPGTDLVNDLGADSLDVLTIALDLDKEFGIKVEDKEVPLFRSCGAIASAVVRHLQNREQSPA